MGPRPARHGKPATLHSMSNLLANLRLRTSVLLVMIAVNLLTSGAFTLHLYGTTRDNIRAGVDQQLRAAANGLRLFADDHHRRLGATPAPTTAEYLSVLRRQAAFARAAKVTYAYTMVERGGKILFTSDSPTDEDFKDASWAKLWEEYTEASPGLKAAFAEGTVQFDEYTDKWGTFRSVFVPVHGEGGASGRILYMIGADIDIAFIAGLLRRELFTSLLIGCAVLALGWAATFGFCRLVFRPLDALVQQVDAIASGDLRRDASVRGSNEIAQLGTRINAMGSALREMLGQVQHSSALLRRTAHELSVQTSASAQGSLRQLAQVESASETALQVREDNDRILDDVRQTRAASEAALRTASSGRAVVANAVDNVRRSEQQSLAVATSIEALNARIVDIDKVLIAIRAIADHTDLLALNAAIEAARAGEQGRGFAVVADEVRALSAKTLTATHEIERTIRAVLHESESTTRAALTSTQDAREANGCMGRVDEALELIARSCVNAHEEIEKIATHAARQADATLEIAATLSHSQTISRDAAQSAMGLSKDAGDLVRLADALAASTARFDTG